MLTTAATIAFGIVAAGFAVALVLVLNRGRRALAVERAETERLRSQFGAATAMLDASPVEFLAWDGPGQGARWSPGLAGMLGVAPDSLFDPAAPAALADGDAAELAERLAALRGHGTPFALVVGCGGRSLALSGNRMASSDILWFQDVSPMAGRIGRADADRAAAQADALRLRQLVDRLPLPVWQRAPDLELIYCNQAYAEAVEAASPAAAAMAGLEIAASVIGQRGRALADRALRAQAPQSESHHVVFGKSRRLLEFTETPPDRGGYMTGFAFDMTSLEVVQGELGRLVDAHAEVLERLGAGIAVFGADGRLRFFNSAYSDLMRLSRDWLKGEPDMGEIIERLREQRRLPEVPDFRAYKRERLALFTNLIEPHEELLQLPDDTTIRSLTAPHPFGGLIVVNEDVTDRLALERSYNTLITVQRETLDELQEGIAVFGSDGRLKLHNPSFLRIWRLDESGMEGEPHVGEVAEKAKTLHVYVGSWEDRKLAVIANEMDRTPNRERYALADGTVLDHVRVPLADGSVLNSYLDVTDSDNVERVLIERAEALEEADRLKTEFLANVSYELRTPLNTIIGFAEILTQRYFGEMNTQQLEYCSGILESSNRLMELINDILDLAMIEAGQLPLHLETVDVEAMLAAVLNLARERARSQQLAIMLYCPATVGEIIGDDRRLRQVLFHLISNAIRFTMPGGTITVGLRSDGDDVAIEVSDTGVGIPEAEQLRVFGAFVRGRAIEQRKPGAGLGLTLVKRFIEMHGGRVELVSEPGTGTHVTCWLPRGGPPLEAPATA
ncbi:MAG: PAS domain-containing sensor histidine kinase [Alphaproteobacteria bacterium]|nr:PAS domain-containing sensor histidine kinase [Alphaproteobacteria bacterium]